MNTAAPAGRNWPFSLRITTEERKLLNQRALRLGLPKAAIARRGLDAELAAERRITRPAPTRRPAGGTRATRRAKPAA